MPEELAIDDMALLESWQRGDRAAAAALLERYHGTVARYFHRKVNGPAREDLIHETFLAVLASPTRFRGQSRFGSYLLGIAHHVLVDHLRRLARWSAPAGSELEPEHAPLATVDGSPAVIAAHQEERRLLGEALRRVPRMHRLALELHYWDELTADEIGEVLEIPPGTAKTRIRTARAYLKAQLEAQLSDVAQGRARRNRRGRPTAPRARGQRRA